MFLNAKSYIVAKAVLVIISYYYLFAIKAHIDNTHVTVQNRQDNKAAFKLH